ncbi:MAG: hypothetical protein QOE05_650, partial [Actinomycetota bacterium]|nr:hypothetical protein [Actinomycetota bacterium]
LRQLTQNLVGAAQKNTDTTADDTPFMTLPTSCGQKRLGATKRTWDETVFRDSAAGEGLFTTTNCDTVPFNPTVDAGPDTNRETPVPHADAILVPADTLDGQHEAHQRDVQAQFPEGLNVSAAAGNDITALDALLGDVSGDSDELGALAGDIRLKSVNEDGSFVILAEVRQRDTPSGARSNVKLALEALVTPDPATGQLTADFDELPQVPFRRLQLEFNGGDTAPLVAPPTCGTNIDHLEFLPWSTTGNAGQVSDDDGWDTTGCPAGEPPRQFSPTVSATLDTTQAAATSQLKVHLEKADRQQNLEGFDLSLPNGLVTKLADFEQCSSANAQAGTCQDASQLGTVAIAAGNGGRPLSLPGKVFLAEPLEQGDLASLVVVVPANVGPFELGTVITRSRIKLDVPRIGVTTTTIDPLPTILKGIPVRVRSIDLTLNNMRNPSSCDAGQFSATFRSQNDPTTAVTRTQEGGRTASSTAAFQATGCENLPFSPKLGVTAFNKPANGNHPAVTTRITQEDREASQQSAKVTLPAGLTPNPAVLQNLCSPAQLAGGGCPANTRVGTARASSPLLPLPLTGPVFVVSRPGEALPKLVVQLRGILNLDLEGIVSLADGGRLATTFSGLPNTPVTSFQLDLLGGDSGSGTPLFSSRADLCNGQQNALGEFASYTGKTASDNVRVAVLGDCPPPDAATVASRNSGKATVTMKVKRVRSGRPVLEMRVARTKTSASLKRVSLSLPKGLRFRSKPTAAVLRGLSVRTANGRRVPRSSIRIEKKRMVITRTQGSPVFRVTLRRGILTADKSLKKLKLRKLKQRRMSFKVGVLDMQNESYSITKRIRPNS